MLTMVTCQAANTVPAGQAIAAYLTDVLGIEVHFDTSLSWQQRLARLIGSEIHLGWVCGSYHALYDRSVLARVAVPVNRGLRYQDRPIYFSDLVVRHDSGFQTLDDLRGRTWGFNEAGSYSGAIGPFYEMAKQGKTAAFFGRIVETGAHAQSLQMITDGEIDGAAIDSTVLAWEQRKNPELAGKLRVIGALGPNPAPPILASRALEPCLREEVRRVLLEMHLSVAGRDALAAGELSRMDAGDDNAYSQMRVAAAAVERASFLKNAL